jgi:hypothetical protein
LTYKTTYGPYLEVRGQFLCIPGTFKNSKFEEKNCYDKETPIFLLPYCTCIHAPWFDVDASIATIVEVLDGRRLACLYSNNVGYQPSSGYWVLGLEYSLLRIMGHVILPPLFSKLTSLRTPLRPSFMSVWTLLRSSNLNSH